MKPIKVTAQRKVNTNTTIYLSSFILIISMFIFRGFGLALRVTVRHRWFLSAERFALCRNIEDVQVEAEFVTLS